MADSRAASGLTVQQWDDKFFTEYLTDNRFAGEMGTDENSIIQVKEDLTKKAGDSVTYALVNRLTNAGVTGTQVLEGNEEDLISRSFRVYVDKIRHGVRVAEMEEQKSAIDLRNAGRAALKVWIMEKTRDQFITAQGSINGVAYTSATEAEKDAWLVDNADRVLFGAAVANNSSNDHSASLLNVDATTDKLTSASLSILKRMALLASPKIRPFKTKDGYEYFVAFCGTNPFRDLKADLKVINYSARAREGRGMDNNPLFQDGDQIYDGVIVREVPEISQFVSNVWTTLKTAGAASARVEPVFLCGQQALAMAWGQMARPTFRKEDDYGFIAGTGIEMAYGVGKIFTKPSGGTKLIQRGMATGFFASAAD